MKIVANAMRRMGVIFLLSALALQLGASLPQNDKKLAGAIDAVMSDIYKPGEPGAAVIVRRDGRTLFRQGYGLADLELGVKVEPDMVFRLGSITKQFTATAILLLAKEGKLSLQDPIGKYLPAFPSGDRKVTVEHLLTHTSGIKSYTNMEEWLKMWRQDMTPQQIIDMSKDKPFEFNPGERWNYNNTGYVMLGAIIEKVSGQTYEDFIQARIFAPLAMTHSCYGSTERVIPRRVPGYQKDNQGIINAPYLSMTQPYAAGSLLSSVDDLAVWNEAVFAGKLLAKEWQDKAFIPYRLANGESTGYGYGWFISDFRGHRCIEHAGGINGFTSQAMAFPDDHVYIAILTNGAIEGRNPEPRAVRIAELVLGLPALKRTPAALTANELDALAGVYENQDGEARFITREGQQLFSQRAGGAKNAILPSSPTEFFFADSPSLIRFVRNAQGRIDGLRVQGRIGPAEIYKRSEKALPSARREIALAPELLDRYAGEYELMPGFVFAVTVEAGHLMGQATGQAKVELFAESPTNFFLKVIDAQIVFDLDAAGRATALTLFQGGQKLPAKKVK